jgi:hypothetical protein
MRKMAQKHPLARGVARVRWTLFGDWLEAGAPGILPETLRLTLGPVWQQVPLARQMAWMLGPWMLALLRACFVGQRRESMNYTSRHE